ncbi:MAG TPA: carboxypeptidase regulatory-like domain-containing protein, partial [Candidatus Hydrogenedentes bacterium]|nr:carboxypeptidase regulatory-like domain-containing protein [Candidatus Hydrogenedentota bacterium]
PATGAPVAGAIVSIEGTGISTETDENGDYVLDNVPTGPQRLIINPPDHELIRRDIDIQPGISADLGATETASIVFDPNAPPSATAYSVIGRHATETISRLTFGQAREVIRDAMLMAGGDEAGVLDEYGNQINPSLTGAGLVSLKPKAIDMLADRMVRNETVSLQEVLYVLSFAFEWSNGYPDLGEWLAFLQMQVDEAWREPTDPENALMVLLFNKQRSIAFAPPVLSPFTRLNALQTHLLVSSILSAAIDAQYSGKKHLSDTEGKRPGTKSVGKNYFTRYWRNFFVTKDSYLQNSLMQGAVAEAGMMASWMMAASTGGIVGAVIGANLAGTAPSYLDDAAINANVVLHIPEPPVMVRADV